MTRACYTFAPTLIFALIVFPWLSPVQAGWRDIWNTLTGEEKSQTQEFTVGRLQVVLDRLSKVPGAKRALPLSSLEHIYDNLGNMQGGHKAAIELFEAIFADIKGGPYQYGLNFARAVTKNTDISLPHLFVGAQWYSAEWEKKLIARAGGSQRALMVVKQILRILRNPKLLKPEPVPVEKQDATPPPPTPEACAITPPIPPAPRRPKKAPSVASCKPCESLEAKIAAVEVTVVPLETAQEQLTAELARNQSAQSAAEDKIRVLEEGLLSEKGIGIESVDTVTGIKISSLDMGNGRVQITTTYPGGRTVTRTRERRSSRKDSAALAAARKSRDQLVQKGKALQLRWDQLGEEIEGMLEQIQRLKVELESCRKECKKSAGPTGRGEGVHVFDDVLTDRYRLVPVTLVPACEECEGATRSVNRISQSLVENARIIRRRMENFNVKMRKAEALLAQDYFDVIIPVGTRNEEFFCRTFSKEVAESYTAKIKAGTLYKGVGGATQILARAETRSSPARMGRIRQLQNDALGTLASIYERVDLQKGLEAEHRKRLETLRDCEAKKCDFQVAVVDLSDAILPGKQRVRVPAKCPECEVAALAHRNAARSLLAAERTLFRESQGDLRDLEVKLEIGDFSAEVRRGVRLRIQALKQRSIPASIAKVRNRTLEESARRKALDACNQERCDDGPGHPDPRVRNFVRGFSGNRLDSPGETTGSRSAGSTQGGSFSYQSQDRWAAVKEALAKIVRAYVNQDISLFQRSLSRNFLQDQAILMNAVRDDFQSQTDINLELQLLNYRFTEDRAVVEVRWQRTVTVQATGQTQLLRGNATLFFDRRDGFTLQGIFGASFVGVGDAAWRQQARRGDTSNTGPEVILDGGDPDVNATDDGSGGGVQTQSSAVIRLGDANFGPAGTPNHVALNLKTNMARTFRRGIGAGSTCAPGACSQAGDDLIISPAFAQGTPNQGFGTFFALQGQGDGGPGPMAAVFDCGFSTLSQQSGVNVGNPRVDFAPGAGPGAYRYVVGVRGTTGLFSLVEVSVTELQGQQVGDVQLTWTVPASANATGFGPGSGGPCGN